MITGSNVLLICAEIQGCTQVILNVNLEAALWLSDMFPVCMYPSQFFFLKNISHIKMSLWDSRFDL